MTPKHFSIFLLFILFLSGCGMVSPSSGVNTTNAEPTNDFQVRITGGHDTDPRDGGRPVILIASALGVPPGVFREAFSHVKPAPAGHEPDPSQVQRNKAALLDALGPYGIGNDLLDQVSNYYRYNRNAGETWPQTPASAIAIVSNGVISGFQIINPGSGYTSPPTITITGSDIQATAILHYDKDFNTNGSLAEIQINR